MRVVVGTLLALALAAGIVLVVMPPDGRAERPVLRDPPALDPVSAEEKVRFWADLYLSGRQDTVAGRRIPVWKLLAEPALMESGDAAVGELLAVEREPAYRASPHLLLPVLALLPRLPGAASHPRFAPFLRARLDASWEPEPTGALAQLAGDLRAAVFRVLAQLPDPAFDGDCVRVLEAGPGSPDLRELAVHILFETRADARLRPLLDALPPNAAEPDGKLRINLLGRLQAMASPVQLEPTRMQVRDWEEQLRAYAAHEDPQEAIPAAAALRHLGIRGGAERLWEIYRGHGGDDLARVTVAWTAMRALAEGTPDPGVHEECLRVARKGGRGLAPMQALEHLGRLYVDEPAVQELLWDAVRSATRAPELGGAFEPYPQLRLLRTADRPGVAAFLESELESGDESRRFEALRFARTYRITEIGPRLLDEAHRTSDPGQRAQILSQLVVLRSDGAASLLRSDFEQAADAQLRAQAAAGLLDLGDAESLALLAGPLAAGEAELVALLFERALQGGRYGVPEALLPALLGALRAGSGESERLRALTTLRLAAPGDDAVTSGLVEAYRREPSLRVADAIRDTLLERRRR